MKGDICPLCGKEMIVKHSDYIQHCGEQLCEFYEEWECGCKYEFSYGAERWLDGNNKEFDPREIQTNNIKINS